MFYHLAIKTVKIFWQVIWTGGAISGRGGVVPRMARALPDDFVVAVESLAARREEMKRLYPDVCERRRKYEEALQAWNV